MVFEILAISVFIGVLVSLYFFLASGASPVFAMITMTLWVVSQQLNDWHERYEINCRQRSKDA